MNTLAAMPLVAMWCVMYCGLYSAPSSPTPSVGHVAGDMNRCESNKTLVNFHLIRCNQYSACNHSVYTTCTQWLHHPSSMFWLLGYTFCSLVPRPHPPQCILLFVHHFLSTLVSRRKKKWNKKPGGLVI